MKILVGVDTARHYQAVINLAARMKFLEPHWILANSVEVKVPIAAYGSAAEAAYRAEYVQLANVAAENAIDEAKGFASAHGYDAESLLLAGSPAVALAQYADEVHADVVAVHSDRKGRLGSFFLGSVSRGLAISAHQSILISKGEIAERGSIKAIFATDHSGYANQALDKLIAMKPQGLTKIDVVSVLHMGSHIPIDQPDPMYAAVAVEDSLWTEAKYKTEETASKLREAGYSSAGKLMNGHVNEILSQAMSESEADVLIMGAQGHGVMHRLMLGSTSLHQVVAEPYSVFLLRP